MDNQGGVPTMGRPFWFLCANDQFVMISGPM
jgi:hypothetical protein